MTWSQRALLNEHDLVTSRVVVDANASHTMRWCRLHPFLPAPQDLTCGPRFACVEARMVSDKRGLDLDLRSEQFGLCVCDSSLGFSGTNCDKPGSMAMAMLCVWLILILHHSLILRTIYPDIRNLLRVRKHLPSTSSVPITMIFCTTMLIVLEWLRAISYAALYLGDSNMRLQRVMMSGTVMLMFGAAALVAFFSPSIVLARVVELFMRRRGFRVRCNRGQRPEELLILAILALAVHVATFLIAIQLDPNAKLISRTSFISLMVAVYTPVLFVFYSYCLNCLKKLEDSPENHLQLQGVRMGLFRSMLDFVRDVVLAAGTIAVATTFRLCSPRPLTLMEPMRRNLVLWLLSTLLLRIGFPIGALATFDMFHTILAFAAERRRGPFQHGRCDAEKKPLGRHPSERYPPFPIHPASTQGSGTSQRQLETSWNNSTSIQNDCTESEIATQEHTPRPAVPNFMSDMLVTEPDTISDSAQLDFRGARPLRISWVAVIRHKLRRQSARVSSLVGAHGLQRGPIEPQKPGADDVHEEQPHESFKDEGAC